MKTLIYTVFSSILLMWATGVAGNNGPGSVEVTKKNLVQKDGKCLVELEITVNNPVVGSNRSLRLTPYLRRDGQIRRMPPFLISGKRRYKAFQRSEALGGSTDYKGIYSAADAGEDGRLVTAYRTTVPYEPWMDDADIVVEEEYCDCGMDALLPKKEEEPEPESVSAPSSPPIVIPELIVVYIEPETEQQKIRGKTIEAFLSYPLDKSEILPNFKNNPEELRQIYIAMEKVKNDSNLKIKSIHIAGFTSPEGAFQTNLVLSEKRAESLKEIIKKRYRLPDNLFKVQGLSEDWPYLEKLVEESTMGGRKEVLEIIRTVGIFEGRERKLMELHEGNVYREMKHRFFPMMRRSVFTLEYYVEQFTLEESKGVFKTRPEQLSLSEIHQIAFSYPKDSYGFRNAFETAVKLFPGDTVANINAGAAALEKRDMVTAEKYLLPFEDDPRAWNNLGVLYMLRKDPAKAAEYILKAPANPEIERNRQLIIEMNQTGTNPSVNQ